MKWYKGSEELKPSPKYNMELTPKHAVLTVKNTDKEDESPYRVAMENDLGKDKADMKAEVKEKEGKEFCVSSWNLPLQSDLFYGSFTLPQTDSVMDSDSDSKPNGYIVLRRTCSHCTDSDSDPYYLFLCRTGIQVQVYTRVHLWQCKWAIREWNVGFLVLEFHD